MIPLPLAMLCAESANLSVSPALTRKRFKVGNQEKQGWQRRICLSILERIEPIAEPDSILIQLDAG
jgi:hypothetical protein